MRKLSFGFTLVEILLVVAILSTISATSYVAFMQFNKGKDLNITAADFYNALNEAKTDTQTQVNAGNCQPNNTFAGYMIWIDPNYTYYQLILVCANSSNVNSYIPFKKRDIPSSVALRVNRVTYDSQGNTQLTPQGWILFRPPYATPDASYAASLNNSIGIGVDENGVILE